MRTRLLHEERRESTGYIQNGKITNRTKTELGNEVYGIAYNNRDMKLEIQGNGIRVRGSR